MYVEFTEKLKIYTKLCVPKKQLSIYRCNNSYQLINSLTLNDKLGELSLEENQGYITLSQRKAPHLYFRGHRFRKSHVNVDFTVRWRCANTNCRVACTTISDKVGEIYEITDLVGDHVEASDPLQLRTLEHRRLLKGFL